MAAQPSVSRRRIARLLITIPWAIPLVVATNIFWWLFDSTFGLFNYLLVSIGVMNKPIDWFLNPRAAMAAVSITTIWKGYPFFTIMLLAALRACLESFTTPRKSTARTAGVSSRRSRCRRFAE